MINNLCSGIMNYLKSTYYLDFEDTEIQQIVSELKFADFSLKEKAISMYLIIRDKWRYNPYNICFTKDCYKASTIAKKTEGHCIEKAILLTACLRALNIPARLHLAKVKNHIAVERLTEKFGTNELSPHGMVDIFIGDKWIKVSPAFNIELCRKSDVAPLDFDGEHDSIFHEFDKSGNLFMEYLEDYGHFEDVPLEFIFENFKTNYPKIFESYKGQSNIEI